MILNVRKRHRLFATTMVIMAGIDLLAKFYDRAERRGEVQKRLERFCSRFWFKESPNADEFARVLYLGCRNPLLHSFTMHSETYDITLTSTVQGGFKPHSVVWRALDQPRTFKSALKAWSRHSWRPLTTTERH